MYFSDFYPTYLDLFDIITIYQINYNKYKRKFISQYSNKSFKSVEDFLKIFELFFQEYICNLEDIKWKDVSEFYLPNIRSRTSIESNYWKLREPMLYEMFSGETLNILCMIDTLTDIYTMMETYNFEIKFNSKNKKTEVIEFFKFCDLKSLANVGRFSLNLEYYYPINPRDRLIYKLNNGSEFPINMNESQMKNIYPLIEIFDAYISDNKEKQFEYIDNELNYLQDQRDKQIRENGKYIIDLLSDKTETNLFGDSLKEDVPINWELFISILTTSVFENNISIIPLIFSPTIVSVDSQNGLALFLEFFDKTKLSLIVSKTTQNIMDNIERACLTHEMSIGYRLNSIYSEIPMFMYTYGWSNFTETPPFHKTIIPATSLGEDVENFGPRYIYMQHAGKYSQSIIDFIKDSERVLELNENIYITSPIEKIFYLFYSIIGNLREMFRRCNFVHHDLHLGNILIRKLDKSENFPIYWNQNRFEIKTNHTPFIIDFGLSNMKDIYSEDPDTYLYSPAGWFLQYPSAIYDDSEQLDIISFLSQLSYLLYNLREQDQINKNDKCLNEFLLFIQKCIWTYLFKYPFDDSTDGYKIFESLGLINLSFVYPQRKYYVKEFWNFFEDENNFPKCLKTFGNKIFKTEKISIKGIKNIKKKESIEDINEPSSIDLNKLIVFEYLTKYPNESIRMLSLNKFNKFSRKEIYLKNFENLQKRSFETTKIPFRSICRFISTIYDTYENNLPTINYTNVILTKKEFRVNNLNKKSSKKKIQIYTLYKLYFNLSYWRKIQLIQQVLPSFVTKKSKLDNIFKLATDRFREYLDCLINEGLSSNLNIDHYLFSTNITNYINSLCLPDRDIYLIENKLNNL